MLQIQPTNTVHTSEMTQNLNKKPVNSQLVHTLTELNHVSEEITALFTDKQDLGAENAATTTTKCQK